MIKDHRENWEPFWWTSHFNKPPNLWNTGALTTFPSPASKWKDLNFLNPSDLDSHLLGRALSFCLTNHDSLLFFFGQGHCSLSPPTWEHPTLFFWRGTIFRRHPLSNHLWPCYKNPAKLRWGDIGHDLTNKKTITTTRTKTKTTTYALAIKSEEWTPSKLQLALLWCLDLDKRPLFTKSVASWTTTRARA